MMLIYTPKTMEKVDYKTLQQEKNFEIQFASGFFTEISTGAKKKE